MNPRHRPLYLLGLVFVLVYLLPLGLRPLFIPDEVRYGEIAREMIARSDWVVPHLNGLHYFEKPIFGHWVNAISQLLFGETRFAVRFPSALAIGLTALLTLRFCRLPARTDEQQSLGTLAALIFLSCFGVFGIGTFAVLDNLLTLCLTLSLVAFFQATEAERGSRQERLWLLLAGVGCGTAFLTKGFLALAIPVLVAVPYLLWQKRGRDLYRMPWIPLFGAILTALPWSIWIKLRAPDFWHYFFFEEHIKRFFSDQAQHAEPLWYFLAMLPLMTIPWTFQAVGIWRGTLYPAALTERETAIQRFAICWLVMPLLFFSASNGKILTYILPCFPAIAVLIVCALDRCLCYCRGKVFNSGGLVAAGFFGLVLILLLVAQQIGWKGQTLYSTTLPWVGGSCALVVAIILFWRSTKGSDGWQKLLLFALAPLPLFAFTPLMMPDLTLAKKAPEEFLAKIAEEISPDDYILVEGGVVRAANWSFKRDDIYLLKARGELDYGLSRPSGAGRFLQLEDARQLIREHPGNVVIFAKQWHYEQWGKELPRPSSLRQNHPKGFVVLRY